MRLAGLLDRHRSTVRKVLPATVLRDGGRPKRRPNRRYEWSQPGALLRIDAFGRRSPTARATGPRASAQGLERRDGQDYVIGVVDDLTRLAYCVLHSGETAVAVAATIRRAAAWFSERGSGSVKAVMRPRAG